MWRDLIAPLSERHRVICLDLRGFGWTDAPPGGYDPEVFARDVVAALDALGISEPVDVIGHDWGGWTAWMIALRHPERMRRLMALNIYHPFIRTTPRAFLSTWRFWYQWVLASPGVGKLANRFSPVHRWVGSRQAPWDEVELEAYLGQFREPARANAGHRLYRHAVVELVPKSVRGEYLGLTSEHEGLMLFGVDDHVQNEKLMPGFERNAPNMRLELVPGAGHFIVDQRPELVRDRAQALFSAPA
jgi:pimeloyl-ACP methyl ester carboxylesterase